MSDDKNFYQVLNCSQDASTDEIRKNYKKLALKCHPDKNPESESDGQFAQLSQAAKTLGDEKERFKYDSNLLEKKSLKKIIYDEISLEDLNQNDESSYSYDCRCGGQYIINSLEHSKTTSSNNNTIIVDCDSCSLSLKILDVHKS